MAPPVYVPAADTQAKLGDRGVSTTSQITEDEVKVALTEFVGDNCCYGAKPILTMTFRDIVMNSSFHVSSSE